MTDDIDTPTIADVIMQASSAIRSPIYVARIAEVTSFSRSRGTVTVRMLVSMRLDDDRYVDGLTIADVPIWYFRCGGYAITADVEVGQHGLVIVRDVSHDEVDSGDLSYPVEPQSTRRHNLSDCIFLPGFIAPQDGPPAGTTAQNRMVLALPSGKVLAVGAAGAGQKLTRDDLLQIELQKISNAIAALGGNYIKAATGSSRVRVDD